MNGANTANRIRIAVVIALTAALALGSFWVLEVMRRGAEEALPMQPRTAPDFYVENFNFVRMTKTGEAQYNVTGTRLTHNPQDDTYDVQQPILNSYGKNRPPMVVRSERAMVENTNSKVHMYDNVHIDRPASPNAQHFQLRSEYLLLLPDDDVMQTDKPVVITLGESRLTGVGMYANNATREFTLSNNVNGIYQAPAQTSTR
jgi:lipopolysaccharide export system protein LptC